MTTDAEFTWFVGLFEGEGCFVFANGKAKRIAISMTDLDVLERVKTIVGGSIWPLKKRQDHWKDAWIWVANGNKAEEIAKQMIPLLGERRTQRAREFLAALDLNREKVNAKKQKHQKLVKEVKKLRELGLTQRKIGDTLGIERSYVSRLLTEAAHGERMQMASS